MLALEHRTQFKFMSLHHIEGHISCLRVQWKKQNKKQSNLEKRVNLSPFKKSGKLNYKSVTVATQFVILTWVEAGFQQVLSSVFFSHEVAPK